MSMNRKAWSAILALVLAAAGWYANRNEPHLPPDASAAGASGSVPVTTSRAREEASELQRAFTGRRRGARLTTDGAVIRILADDQDGSPHQRFIIEGDEGISVLVAHNLDLAPRLEGLRAGDQVSVLGEYEWNERGGVLHWTHDDPGGRHPAGHIDWNGRRYQ
jgi:hypothetical protein